MRRFIVIIAMFATLSLAVHETLAAGPGGVRSRTRPRGQSTTRTYRSYSVTPGNVTIPESGPIPDGSEIAPRPVPSPAAPRRPASSKPSYMRADSKAMGRFGQ